MFYFKMTHLSRSDSDKMLSDMAEGSAADYNEADYDNGGYDTDEISGYGPGSGDDSKYFKIKSNFKQKHLTFLFSSS